MNEMLVYRVGQLVEVMVFMMNVVMKSEYCPLDWKRGLLVPFHRDAVVEQVSNYRGIALGCKCCEGLLMIGFRLKHRGGFRSGRRCSDQLLVLRGVCELKEGEEKFVSDLPGY